MIQLVLCFGVRCARRGRSRVPPASTRRQRRLLRPAGTTVARSPVARARWLARVRLTSERVVEMERLCVLYIFLFYIPPGGGSKGRPGKIR